MISRSDVQPDWDWEMVPVAYREVIRIRVRNTAKLTLCRGPLSSEDSVVSYHALIPCILPDAIARIGLRDRNHALMLAAMKVVSCVSTLSKSTRATGGSPGWYDAIPSDSHVLGASLAEPHRPKQLRGALARTISNLPGTFDANWRLQRI
ncbi:hypothetical protein B0H19DRAFT_1079678 [Mycena capillaripes]|nr:hypothetical protein B0H19DRAFT_1079678 [Mycena capillaripes]